MALATANQRYAFRALARAAGVVRVGKDELPPAMNGVLPHLKIARMRFKAVRKTAGPFAYGASPMAALQNLRREFAAGVANKDGFGAP